MAGDNAWQRHARRLQSDWRERQHLKPGDHRRVPLGSRLTLADGAPPRLAGYMTDAAKKQVMLAIDGATASGALLSRPRLWVDLLSSQPQSFNLFGDMADDLDFAGAVWSSLMPTMVSTVKTVRFEYSPGRGDARYTGSRSAFDVFLECTGPAGRGFLGIELKYAENMKVGAATDRGYEQMARATGIFREDSLPKLLRPPMQQLLLDHLLAVRLQSVDSHVWDWGMFVLLYPSQNVACATTALNYEQTLAERTTFRTVLLEELLSAMLHASHGASWVAELHRRYLGAD